MVVSLSYNSLLSTYFSLKYPSGIVKFSMTCEWHFELYVSSTQ